jgi:hypothetical protein
MTSTRFRFCRRLVSSRIGDPEESWGAYNSQTKTPLGKVVRVRLQFGVSSVFRPFTPGSSHVLGLHDAASRHQSAFCRRIRPLRPHSRPAFPPSTSSPMIKHAAVWIFRAARSAAVIPGVVVVPEAMVLRSVAAEAWAALGSGRER